MNSIWSEKQPRILSKEKTLPERVEVVIIGGGIAGLLCAFLLKEAGIETIVLEADNASLSPDILNSDSSPISSFLSDETDVKLLSYMLSSLAATEAMHSKATSKTDKIIKIFLNFIQSPTVLFML